MADAKVGTAELSTWLKRYRSLYGHGTRHDALEGFEIGTGATEAEVAIEGPQADLTTAGIKDHLSRTRAELHQIVKTFLGDKPELHDVADQIVDNGGEGLAAIGENDEERLGQPDVLMHLEVIVVADGTRPSFMVRDGAPDLTTSPLGNWQIVFLDEPDVLKTAISSVGRIDVPSARQGFSGTGALIGPNLVLTNRHVLQSIAVLDAGTGQWDLKANLAIDFGHEHQSRETIGRRALKRVVFTGKDFIDVNNLDHAKLDLALIEIEPVNGPAVVPPLPLDLTPGWTSSDRKLFIVGYPGQPEYSEANPPSLLEKLFLQTFGCKRIAPGQILRSADVMAAGPRKWATSHDATTLGGNSGSAVLLIGRTSASVGLHYGGRSRAPKENWCHVIERTLAETDGRSSKTVLDHLKDHDVELRFANPPTG